MANARPVRRSTEHDGERLAATSRALEWRVWKFGRIALTSQEYRAVCVSRRHVERSGTEIGVAKSVASALHCTETVAQRLLWSAQNVLLYLEVQGEPWSWEFIDGEWKLIVPREWPRDRAPAHPQRRHIRTAP